MPATQLTTWFAPAARTAPEEVHQQAQQFLMLSPMLRAILDAIPDAVMALNATRQIVFANRSLKLLTGMDETNLIGLRPGEALGCQHALAEPAGCGTTEYCVTCGGAQATLAAGCGLPDTQECRITRCMDGEALDFRVSSTPLMAGQERFTLLTLVDISNEKRRRTLERLFFHDVLNTATAVKAATDLMARRGSHDLGDLPMLMRGLVDRLIDEIVAQRQLTDAENGELAANPVRVNVMVLLSDLARGFSYHPIAKDKTISLIPPGGLHLVTDPTLLRRVLGNLLKNALEACAAGEAVTLGCNAQGTAIEFSVHNPGVMPRDVQLQIFQRSFSTKGPGRGLGTYSAKLLSERYLGGQVSFISTAGEGTTFRVTLPAQPAPREPA